MSTPSPRQVQTGIDAALSSLRSATGSGSDLAIVDTADFHEEDQPHVHLDGGLDLPHLVRDILSAALALSEVDRLEVIGPDGRELSSHDVEDVELALQDENHTLKVFYRAATTTHHHDQEGDR